MSDHHESPNETGRVEQHESPNGCAHCGVEQRDHGQRLDQGPGIHQYTPPTDAQRLARMRARRAQADNTETAAGDDDILTEQATALLRSLGLTDQPEEYGDGIHSWRCEHPDRYGRCACFAEAVGDLVDLIRARENTAALAALDGFIRTELALVPENEEPDEDDEDSGIGPIRTQKQALAWRALVYANEHHPAENSIPKETR